MNDGDKLALRNEAQTLSERLAALRTFAITAPEQRAAFAQMLAAVQAMRKSLAARKKAATAAVRADLSAKCDHFRPAEDVCDALDARIKEILQEYEVRCSLAVSEATGRAQALVAMGDAAGAQAALATAGQAYDVVSGAAPGMQVRHPWKFEVFNLSIAPMEYHLPHLQALEAEMRRQLAEKPDVLPAIPGVRFWRDLQIAGAPAERTKRK